MLRPEYCIASILATEIQVMSSNSRMLDAAALWYISKAAINEISYHGAIFLVEYILAFLKFQLFFYFFILG